ncbi:MAG: hypothetical protein ACI4KF_05375 [Huintestinicola sp.]
MDNEHIRELAKKYYPIFTFDDGLMTALILLTALGLTGIFAGGEMPSSAEMLSAAVKIITGWCGTIWVVGGKDYFCFVKQRLLLGKILKTEYLADGCKPVLNAHKEQSSLKKRYKCTAQCYGETYRITTKQFMAAAVSEKAYILSGEGIKGTVFLPEESDKQFSQEM